ncbi:4-hydroxy-tetrahydrodipicolinate reductase [Sphingobium faniae]|nr:4-hydroxy-tetrahydrodipicolinate reductase [Sphingobium faniae]
MAVNISKPIKVIVWGPGSLGGACLREVMKLPEYELVGVLAFDPAKDGMDAGDLIAGPKTGVRVTTDKEAIFALDADCVIHTPRALPDFHDYDADVIRLLESGKNVVSGACYHFPPIHGDDYAQRLEQGCVKGGVSLHGTGVHPGFLMERLAITATGLSNRVETIAIREVTDCSRIQSRPFMEAFGFGADPAAFDPDGPVSQLTDRYFHEAIEFVGRRLWGRPLDRIEKISRPEVAQEDIEILCMTIPKGRISNIIYEFTGYLDGEAKIVLGQYWYQRHSPVPEATSPHYWDIEVEGEPCSLRLRLDAFASARRQSEEIEGDPTMLTFYATGVPILQAIPRVCAAPPGLVYADVFGHFAPDLRSIVEPVG